ncbi:unnamed protein product, partial [Trichobilharzia regenti]
ICIGKCIGDHDIKSFTKIQNVKNHFPANLKAYSLNLNGIDLMNVLVGNMVPGIYLKSRKNIEFNPNFKADIKNLQTHYERSKPGTTNYKEANDMQISANDLLDKATDYKPQPIVIPKSDCSTSNQVFNYEECQPADEDGIIRPFVTFNNNYLMPVAAA